jgi:hypothetical protein
MSQQDKRIGLGVVLIGVGGLFLLSNLGFIPWDVKRYLFSWQGILIIIGSAFLITKPDKTPGIILVSIGVFFLLPKILDVPWFSMSTFWPLVLIAVGIVFILRQRGQVPFGKSNNENDIDVLDDVNIFGGGEVVISSQNFKGGKVTSIFGGGNYNMISTKLADEPVVIDVFAAFGGSSFVIPANWNVRVEVTSIFGGFSDSRKPSAETVIDTSKVMIIKGTVLFGGGEIKGY